MFKNYLKTSLRSFRRQKGYAVINMLGLAVGLACALLISSYVQFERSFDRFHTNADQIYRVVQQQPGNVFLGSDRFAVTQAGLSKALREEISMVEEATTFAGQTALIEHGGQGFMEPGFRADAYFFRVFSFALTSGDPATVLARPNTVVLTTSLAEKLFGTDDPLGNTVRFNDSEEFTVTGIAEDPPLASHLTFSYVRSVLSEEFYLKNLNRWSNNSWFNYFRLESGQSPDILETQLAALLRKYRPDEEDLPRLYLEPLTSIHLHSQINFDVAQNNDIQLLYLFSAIAFIILLLACANYTNLAVARSVSRARDIGMRKVVGASRLQIAVQHLGESILTAMLALALGLGLAQLALPAFSGWLERDLVLGAASGGWFYLEAIGLAILVGLMAGAYPAFVMTQFKPASILKGNQPSVLGRFRLRTLLVVGQYTAAIILVIGSLVIYQQMRFIQDRPLGFDREHVVGIYLRGIDIDEELPSFKVNLEQVPGVIGVTSSTSFPTNISSSTSLDAWEGHPEVEGERMKIYQTMADYDYLDVYGISLVAGRYFSPAHPADTAGAVVLNETAVRQLGWTLENAVGRTVRRNNNDLPVIGVVKDFQMHAMHLPTAPLMIQLASSWVNRVGIRIRPDDLSNTLAGIEATWAQNTPFPFDYQFLDDNFNQLYKADLKLGEGVGYFTIIALLIAGLGLFGLATHTAEQRTKEIGVRKVLGASIPSLIALLSIDFVKIVVIAFTLAAPVAYFAMSRWLSDFAFRIELSWQIFVWAGIAALLTALLTVSYQAVRAALADPVKSLRYE